MRLCTGEHTAVTWKERARLLRERLSGGISLTQYAATARKRPMIPRKGTKYKAFYLHTCMCMYTYIYTQIVHTFNTKGKHPSGYHNPQKIRKKEFKKGLSGLLF